MSEREMVCRGILAIGQGCGNCRRCAEFRQQVASSEREMAEAAEEYARRLNRGPTETIRICNAWLVGRASAAKRISALEQALKVATEGLEDIASEAPCRNCKDCKTCGFGVGCLQKLARYALAEIRRMEEGE